MWAQPHGQAVLPQALLLPSTLGDPCLLSWKLQKGTGASCACLAVVALWDNGILLSLTCNIRTAQAAAPLWGLLSAQDPRAFPFLHKGLFLWARAIHLAHFCHLLPSGAHNHSPHEHPLLSCGFCPPDRVLHPVGLLPRSHSPLVPSATQHP